MMENIEGKRTERPFNTDIDGKPGEKRPPVRRVPGAPYQFERDYDEKHWCVTYNDKLGGLYIGQSKYAKKHITKENGAIGWINVKEKNTKAFVVPHKRGLLLIEEFNGGWNRTIIPGEMSFTGTVRMLAKNIIPMKRLSISENYTNIDFNNEDKKFKLFAFANVENGLSELKKIAALRTRKAEIANALLKNNIWKSRGFSDPKNKIPNEFWRWASNDNLVKGDLRNGKSWWIDHIRLTLEKEKYNQLKDYATNNINYNIETKKEKQAVGLKRRTFINNIIKLAIKEKLIPEYPWDIRDWNKFNSEELVKLVSSGFHLCEKWNAYVKIGMPLIKDALKLREISSFLILEKNNKTQEDSLENINQWMTMAINLKNEETNTDLFVKETEELLNKEPIIIINGKRKNEIKEFYSSKFDVTPPEGWAWDENDKTTLSENSRKVEYWNVLYTNTAYDRRECAFAFYREGSSTHTKKPGWKILDYYNTDMANVREMEILEKVLNVLHKNPKINKKENKNDLTTCFLDNNINNKINSVGKIRT